jgi:hypothetical protein
MPEWGMVQHRERSASALAHGAAKTSDILRARRDLGAAELGAARALQRAAARHRREASRRVTQPPGARGR